MHISTRRLPLSFDVDKLEQDLRQVRGDEWTPMAEVYLKSGRYWAAALIAPNGEQHNVDTLVGEFHPTPLLDRSPYFQEVLRSFDGPCRRVRLLRMEPGTALRTHIDLLDEEYYRVVRIHVPIVTNAACEMTYRGQDVHMNPGECWYVDSGFAHSARNEGRADRIHLVIDTEITLHLDRLAGFDIFEYRRVRFPEYIRDYRKYHAPPLPQRIWARLRGRPIRDVFVGIPMNWWKQA